MIPGKSKNPKVAVAGHLVDDRLVFPDGRQVSALGGISYNLAALCSINNHGTIIPVCELGFDIVERFYGFFGRYENIALDYIKKIDLPNVVNQLTYSDDGNRQEWNSRIPDQLPLNGLPLDMDALLMNFISGDDVSIEELSEFKKSFRGIIYMDYHSLSLGRNSDGTRFFSRNQNWKEYVACADILQLNLRELATISDVEIADKEGLAENCAAIHSLGPSHIVVTMGNDGIFASLDKGSTKFVVPAIKIERETDTTGCGDTVAAVCLFEYLKTGDLESALPIASSWAAAKAMFSGIDGFHTIDKLVASLGRPQPAVRL